MIFECFSLFWTMQTHAQAGRNTQQLFVMYVRKTMFNKIRQSWEKKIIYFVGSLECKTKKKWTKNLQFKIIPRWRKMRRFITNLLLILLTCVYVSARTRFLTYRNVATNPYGTDYASNQYGGRFGHKNTVRIRKPDASLPDVLCLLFNCCICNCPTIYIMDISVWY